MSKRHVDKKFIAEMERKLESGRSRGYVGWDRHWNNCSFLISPQGVRELLFKKLQAEQTELLLAVASGDPKRILEEAADVANMAMMVADIHGGLRSKKE